MLVFFALRNAKVLIFALGDTEVPNANGFASQWNIGFTSCQFNYNFYYTCKAFMNLKRLLFFSTTFTFVLNLTVRFVTSPTPTNSHMVITRLVTRVNIVHKIRFELMLT